MIGTRKDVSPYDKYELHSEIAVNILSESSSRNRIAVGPVRAVDWTGPTTPINLLERTKGSQVYLQRSENE